MAQQRQHVMMGDEKRATEYLANERTFLAWIRKSIALCWLIVYMLLTAQHA